MRVSATEAKNRLGQVLEHAQRAPVFIEKAGRQHSVVVSAELYEAMVASATRNTAPTSGAAFYKQYKAWVDEQNRRVEQHGVFGEEWRSW